MKKLWTLFVGMFSRETVQKQADEDGLSNLYLISGRLGKLEGLTLTLIATRMENSGLQFGLAWNRDEQVPAYYNLQLPLGKWVWLFKRLLSMGRLELIYEKCSSPIQDSYLLNLTSPEQKRALLQFWQ